MSNVRSIPIMPLSDYPLIFTDEGGEGKLQSTINCPVCAAGLLKGGWLEDSPETIIVHLTCPNCKEKRNFLIF